MKFVYMDHNLFHVWNFNQHSKGEQIKVLCPLSNVVMCVIERVCVRDDGKKNSWKKRGGETPAVSPRAGYIPGKVVHD